MACATVASTELPSQPDVPPSQLAEVAPAVQALSSGDHDVILPSKGSRWNEVTYSLAVFLVAGFACLINILLWSAPYGLAATTMRWLIVDGYAWWTYPQGIAMLLFGVLYIFDFFWPPHLGGKHLMLWKGDSCFGRLIFVVALSLLVFSFYLWARDYPSIPIVITLLVEPILVAIFRILTRPSAFQINEDQARSAQVSQKVGMLKMIVVEEEDVLAFYKGCTVAFLAAFIGCLVIFLLALPDAGSEAKSKLDREVAEMCWSTPLIVAIANLLFALLTLLRTMLQKDYKYTDKLKGDLVMDTKRSSMVNQLTHLRISSLQAQMPENSRLSQEAQDLITEDTKHDFINQHADHLGSILMVLKIFGIVFFVLAGLVYGMVSFSGLDEDITNLVMGLIGVFGMLLIVFFYVSLRRVAQELGRWIRDLPAWKKVYNMKDHSLVRAFFSCILLQMIPFVIAMSFLNQSVRRCRGLYKSMKDLQTSNYGDISTPVADDASPTATTTSFGPGVSSGVSNPNIMPDADKRCLTPRVSSFAAQVRTWNPYAVVPMVKLLCLLFIMYYVVQPCFNIVFAYLKDLLAPIAFGYILILTFWIGVVAFLLPPVPGMTVYIFGGLIVSNQCPDYLGGFWGGAFWNILLCWGLKLVACAIQQKIIGENLGKTFYIRSLIGVHTVQVRCFEKILRKKGWTLGKVALLCGGPDWPVSVTAGILKLSLVQCEIGTIPIIVFVIPCALTGSLYDPPPDGNYDTLFKMMVFLSLGTSGIMFAIIMWAVQKTLEENYYELTRRLIHNVDLHYADFKNEQIAAKATIKWADVPSVMRWIYVGQSVVDIGCCTIIYWGYNYLFGTFEVQQDIDTLVIYGEGGVYNMYSVAILIVWSITWILHVSFDVWKKAQTRKEREDLCKELAKTEQQWKDNWCKEAEEMEKKHQEEEEEKERLLRELAEGRELRRSQIRASVESSVASSPPARGDTVESLVVERGSLAPSTGLASDSLSADDTDAPAPATAKNEKESQNAPMDDQSKEPALDTIKEQAPATELMPDSAKTTDADAKEQAPPVSTLMAPTTDEFSPRPKANEVSYVTPAPRVSFLSCCNEDPGA